MGKFLVLKGENFEGNSIGKVEFPINYLPGFVKKSINTSQYIGEVLDDNVIELQVVGTSANLDVSLNRSIELKAGKYYLHLRNTLGTLGLGNLYVTLSGIPASRTSCGSKNKIFEFNVQENTNVSLIRLNSQSLTTPYDLSLQITLENVGYETQWNDLEHINI